MIFSIALGKYKYPEECMWLQNLCRNGQRVIRLLKLWTPFFLIKWYMQSFLIWKESIYDSCFDSIVVNSGLHIGFSAPPFPDSSTKHPDFNCMCTLDISTFKTICIFLNYPLGKLVSVDIIVIQIGQARVSEDD